MSGSTDIPVPALAHLRLHLERVKILLARYVARYGHRMLQAGGKLSDLYVGLGEAGNFFSAAPQHSLVEQQEWPSEAQCNSRLAVLDAQLAEALGAWADTADPEHGLQLPIEELRALFRLEPDDLQLLLLAAAPLLSVDLARLYTFAWADFAVKRPTVGFLAELAASTLDDGPRLVHRFANHAPLVTRSLVELRDIDVWGTPTPLLHRHVVVPQSIVSTLQNATANLPTTLRRIERGTTEIPLTLHDSTQAALETGLRFAIGNQGRAIRLALIGRPGSGRRTALCALLAATDQGVIEVTATDLLRDETLLANARREATMRNCVLLIDADGVVVDKHGPAIETLATHLQHAEEWLAVRFTEQTPAIETLFPGRLPIRFVNPNKATQRELWTAALARHDVHDHDLVSALGRQFDLTPGVIVRVSDAAALESTATRGNANKLDLGLLSDALRTHVRHSLGDLAEPITSSLTWDDVVLPDLLSQRLHSIIEHAELGEVVLETWGYRRRFPYGVGLSCLFNGPPGTGKTMVAGVIANMLGRDLYRIDLSRITSKWVGETEKNLARIFQEAEGSQVILLFDEADSLFSTRGKVDKASDRYANLEVNYLLQRIETFEGMCILTTNFEEGIDDAFKRRIRFRLDFPFPDESQRARIWSALVTPESQGDAPLDFEVLGQRFSYSGGHIKNAVLRAAFAAASRGQRIAQADLVAAATAEAREIGMLIKDDEDFADGPFDEL